MKKYIVWFIILTSCDLFVEQHNPPNIENANVNISVKKVDKKEISEKINILPYHGKYSLKNRFWSSQKLLKAKKDTETVLAEKIGFLQDRSLSLEIEYVDWQPQHKDQKFMITPQANSSKQIWRITYISEHLQNGSVPLSTIYKIAIAEVLLRQKAGDHYDKIPEFLWKSIVSYGCGFIDYELKQLLLHVVNTKNFSLEKAVVGLNTSQQPFPKLEGIFLLIFFKEKYGEENVVKDFVSNIVFNEKNWEKQISISSGEDFATFTQKVATFANNYLISRYRSVISKYNEALKSYLTENYGSAIAKGQTFTLNYHDSFLNHDMHFWMAMCYYELKNYSQCSEQLQNIFSDKRYLCHHLSLANYRQAMTLYRSQKLSVAIDMFSDFRRDFPWEVDFVGSSLFFQGQSFLANNQYERAIHHFEEFIDRHPKHHRRAAVVEKMAYLYLQMERYKRAKTLFAELQQLDVEDKIKLLAKQSVQKIRSFESQNPSPELKLQLDEIVAHFPSHTKNQKRETLSDLSYIGEISLPWLQSLYKHSSDILPSFIQCISDIQSSKGISLLLNILRTESKYDKELFVALAQIGVPVSELETILVQEFQDVPQKRRLEISNNFRKLFWGAPIEILQKLPLFIENINGDEQKQDEVIEKMSLTLGQEQIPVLKKLVLHGKSEKVKIHALENLILWEDSQMPNFLNDLLFKEQQEIRYIALMGLKKQKYYRITKFKELFLDSYDKVREQALNLLPFVDISGKIDILVFLLNDSNYDIRNRARQNLIDAKDSGVNLALAKGLVKDVQNINYYNYIIQILRVRTNNFELLKTYHPKMSSEQRKELANQLILKWKS
ncbi:tetratricopeptide repeat protein [Candidatus Uabimicrobium sp. HlEnr_7]|uniref:tetratricopeptide repeat protein n=1 Tax=Candidatus Uabimicrobium helgolandensis TaxID=3095367 RepID=UPI003557AB1B